MVEDQQQGEQALQPGLEPQEASEPEEREDWALLPRELLEVRITCHAACQLPHDEAAQSLHAASWMRLAPSALHTCHKVTNLHAIMGPVSKGSSSTARPGLLLPGASNATGRSLATPNCLHCC